MSNYARQLDDQLDQFSRTETQKKALSMLESPHWNKERKATVFMNRFDY